jgi:nicotinamidase-related amidase
LKAKHSAFYSTTLDLLLAYLGAKTLILTGVASDICVLFTANDAYMRDYDLFVPRDCVAASDEKSNEATLEYIERVLKADTRPSAEIDLQKL